MKVAQIQMKVSKDKEETKKRVEKFIEDIRNENVDLVCLGEMFDCPYDINLFHSYAEKEGGDIYNFLSNIAEKYKVYLSAGSISELDGNSVYNTAYVFDRDGNKIAKHRKMHLFDIDIKGGQSFKESETLTAGNQITTFNTEFGKMGLCICYDFRFPELSRLMTLDGAKVILVPASFNLTTGPSHWQTMFKSQALNNQVFVIGTSPARDMKASYKSYGHSIITDPWGEIVSELDSKEGIMIKNLDLTKIDEIREQLPLLKHRREDIYTICKR
ncbi:MAG: carbon-nitrogen hydrolase family protein [Pleomorphochaeta sp.]